MASPDSVRACTRGNFFDQGGAINILLRATTLSWQRRRKAQRRRRPRREANSAAASLLDRIINASGGSAIASGHGLINARLHLQYREPKSSESIASGMRWGVTPHDEAAWNAPLAEQSAGGEISAATKVELKHRGTMVAILNNRASQPLIGEPNLDVAGVALRIAERRDNH